MARRDPKHTRTRNPKLTEEQIVTGGLVLLGLGALAWAMWPKKALPASSTPPACPPGQVLVNGRCIGIQVTPPAVNVNVPPPVVVVTPPPVQQQPPPSDPPPVQIGCPPGQVLIEGKCVPVIIPPPGTGTEEEPPPGGDPEPSGPCGPGQVLDPATNLCVQDMQVIRSGDKVLFVYEADDPTKGNIFVGRLNQIQPLTTTTAVRLASGQEPEALVAIAEKADFDIVIVWSKTLGQRTWRRDSTGPAMPSIDVYDTKLEVDTRAAHYAAQQAAGLDQFAIWTVSGELPARIEDLLVELTRTTGPNAARVA